MYKTENHNENNLLIYRSAIDRETAGSVDMDADDHSSPGKPSHEPAQFLISARRGRSWTAKFPSPWAIGLNPDLWLLSDFRGTTSRGSAGIRARTSRDDMAFACSSIKRGEFPDQFHGDLDAGDGGVRD